MSAPESIRTVIVDDESLARSNIRLLLGCDPLIEIVAECGSGPEAPGLLRRLRPDLLFLDVQMPECDGFEVLELLGASLPAAIVFVTAYDQYALRAFEAGALDYLLKPFDNVRFDLALSRAKDKIAMGKDRKGPGRFAIKSAGQIDFVSLAEIDWIEAADYYAALHIGARTHFLCRSLSELEEELDRALFCRVHRSAIVNLARICGLRLNEDGDYTVLLSNDAEVRLSRKYRKQLRSRLGLSD